MFPFSRDLFQHPADIIKHNSGGGSSIVCGDTLVCSRVVLSPMWDEMSAFVSTARSSGDKRVKPTGPKRGSLAQLVSTDPKNHSK